MSSHPFYQPVMLINSKVNLTQNSRSTKMSPIQNHLKILDHPCSCIIKEVATEDLSWRQNFCSPLSKHLKQLYYLGILKCAKWKICRYDGTESLRLNCRFLKGAEWHVKHIKNFQLALHHNFRLLWWTLVEIRFLGKPFLWANWVLGWCTVLQSLSMNFSFSFCINWHVRARIDPFSTKNMGSHCCLVASGFTSLEACYCRCLNTHLDIR